MAVVAPPAALPGGDGIPSDQRTVVAFLRRCLAGATVEDISAGAGLSMARAERCLDVLSASGIVRCEETRVLWGFGSVPAYLWSLSLTEGCLDLLARLPWQDPPPSAPPERVPPQFWWLFSSGTHPAELRLPQDAVTVAGRMFGGDPAARAWALTNLPLGALRELRAMRSYDAGPDAVSLDIAIAHRADA